MTSALDVPCGPSGLLDQEPPDTTEYLGLLKSGETRLADARRAENSLEGRFDLADKAAHALCLAAQRRAGYRSSKRYAVFQALPRTLGRQADLLANAPDQFPREQDLLHPLQLLGQVAVVEAGVLLQHQVHDPLALLVGRAPGGGLPPVAQRLDTRFRGLLVSDASYGYGGVPASGGCGAPWCRRGLPDGIM
jgi:hypothetical protein